MLFLQLMIRHHEGGKPMLRVAAENAEVAQVRNLASQMLEAQRTGTEMMRRMLAERGDESLPG
ncbi:DUF305 domain-containing protein [Pseudonocardia adelaidensis]